MPPIASDTIRDRFSSYLSEGGHEIAEPVRETILIQNGYYCGRKYQSEGHTLVWFVEEDQLKMYGPNGALMWSCKPHAFLSSSPNIRRAA
ncbi:MAG: hypothetical protein U0905_06800 [Pirellulales bacterium]